MKKLKGRKIIGEFKNFTLRGNVVDLAVGVIIGGAFQAIVKSLVSDIIMPLISRLGGHLDYSNWFIVLGRLPAAYDADRIDTLSYVRDVLGVPVFAYGQFITAVINFLIMAVIIFFMVKFINKLRSLGEKNAPEPSEEKECEFCKTKIPAAAVRCPHCTSILDGE
ncbi:MAG TPA: large conductance mechanosensitive channel protein MscL [Ruminococcaceae bacterium]|nr:large conductance mechanosensitive channel protein MscL [Oscillospiraceae bacterium]